MSWSVSGGVLRAGKLSLNLYRVDAITLGDPDPDGQVVMSFHTSGLGLFGLKVQPDLVSKIENAWAGTIHGGEA